MANNIAEVRMWGRTAGYAAWDQKKQCTVFEYDPEFIETGYEPAPITMPLSPYTYRFESLSRDTFNGLPGMLSDSLPDSYGNSLIDLWITKNNIRKSDFTPLHRLCYVGKRGMGALEYEPSVSRTYDGGIDVNLLSELAADVLRERENTELELTQEGLQELLSVGTSAGGARAKAVIGLSDSMDDIRSGQANLPDGYSHWLIKFDTEPKGSAKKGYCHIEHAYYEMAKDCGIGMAECRLLEIGNKAHFLTERFDRRGREKIHSQTLCALAHYDFKVPGKYSYEDMLTIMRGLRMPYSDQEEVFRRMVFNVIMMNRDDHPKNFSFLLGEKGSWRLSPAYDVTYAFDPSNYWTHQHQISIGGKLLDITQKDLASFAYRMNINNPKDIIETVLSVAAEWKRYAKSSGVPEDSCRKIDAALIRNI